MKLQISNLKLGEVKGKNLNGRYSTGSCVLFLLPLGDFLNIEPNLCKSRVISNETQIYFNDLPAFIITINQV